MSRTYRILVGSDDPTTVLILARAMEGAGYEIRTADNDAGFLDVALQFEPDLILLEPRTSDYDPLQQLRDLRAGTGVADVPVIFVMDAAQPERVIEVFSAGGCDYVVKPFAVREVLARVQTQLRLRTADQELRLREAQLQEVNAKLANVCSQDPVTNLLNRRAWEERLIQQHGILERYQRPYAVIMIDIDSFRAYNDLCGRRAGDDCVCRVADAIAAACRHVDVVGRYGGDEFVVLAPETDGEDALRLADRIHRAVWGLGLPHPGGTGSPRVTASLGVAVSGPSCWEDVLKKADAALVVAKRAGRNMVYAGQELTPPIPSAMPVLASPPTPAAPPDDRIEVLVVDDDPTNRAVCKGCLQRNGYRVREASDGCMALEQVKHERPDVIIMDVMMPNMDGLECTRTLRTDPDTRDIPIIIVSALSRTEDILAGLQAGADEYISKPIRASELTLRVQSMARLHRERSDLLNSYEQRGRQMRILTRLVEFCRAVGLCERAEDILAYAVGAVADVVDCRRVSIMLPDKAEQFLNIASSLGLDESLARDVHVPLGETTAGRVFSSGQPIVVNSEAEAVGGSGDYDAPYFASFPLISAPLDAAGRVVGVLNATEKLGRTPFESRDLEYIELISKVAGTAIHDVHMREAREQASDSIMVALASLAECRDNDTGRHLERVTRFCVLLAEAIRQTDQYRDQIDDDFIYKLERSVPLHDIGKVGIPDSILLFPGKLSDEQMSIMRTHANVGARTIESLMTRAPGVCFLEMARDIAAHHHERWDGRGYPDGLRARDIPLSARITTVADVYDALTSRRVYKEACTHDKAVTIILEGSGSAFDPDIVEAFMQREKAFAELATSLADSSALPQKKQPAQPALTAG